MFQLLEPQDCLLHSLFLWSSNLRYRLNLFEDISTCALGTPRRGKLVERWSVRNDGKVGGDGWDVGVCCVSLLSGTRLEEWEVCGDPVENFC